MINSRIEIKDGYYSEVRKPMLSLVKGRPRRVLELGCATGQTMEYFSSQGAEVVVGIEACPEVAAIAASRQVGRVVVGDVESLNLDFESDSFDLLVAGHVLEHLVDPWKALGKLSRLLRKGGQIVGALPNVRHHSVVIPLVLNGKWEYQCSGIMDWTHLRFFSAETVATLLRGAGFNVEKIVPEFGGPKSRIVNAITFHIFADFLSYAVDFSAFRA